MMNVLFVVPNYPGRVSEYLILPSIELCIISSILKQNNISVSIIDMRIDNILVENLDNILKNYNPNLILIDDIPEVHCNSVKIIDKLRKFYGEKIKIGIRGEIASFAPLMVMQRNINLDFILRYNYDYSLLNYIKNYSDIDKLREINNIVFRYNNEIIINNIKNCDYELDSLPMPDRELYDIKKYLSRDSETIVKSSRGCPGNCIFCIKTKMEKFQLFSMKRFCDEIEILLNYGFKSFFFSDDTFAFSMKRLEEFAYEIKKRNLRIRWTSNIRIKDITDEKIKLMKNLGAYRVFVGIETINEESSNIINKKLKKQEIEEKINILKKHDMQFHASFILGNPGDTEKDLENTIKFVKKIQPTLVTFNLIKIYPGLELYNNPEKYDMIMPDEFWFEKDEWTNKVIMGTKKLPPEKLEFWAKKMLWEFIQ